MDNKETSPAKAAYSIAEFCGLVSLGRSRVFEEIREKRLRIVKVGRRTLIPATEVSAWLERLAGEPVRA
ncbi:excisionase family DNA-binding protein [Geothrix oryzisoli]|uniref:excisionase family DNA-binding protein n=1 Tax=Geothrix oryzisoli TaxID=2922721 RepID=UPI001FABC127|nr:excisionase family DNA-binding protein [Geothrix oryzisoli]